MGWHGGRLGRGSPAVSLPNPTRQRFHTRGITIPCSQSRRWRRSAHRRQILRTPRRSSTTSGNPDRVKSRIIPQASFSCVTVSGEPGPFWARENIPRFPSKENHSVGPGNYFVREVFPNKEDEKLTGKQSQVSIPAPATEEHGSPRALPFIL